MEVLAVLPLPVVIKAGTGLIAGTILLCYTLAVGLGHVPAWLPMISDCAVEAPERYPFRMGIVLGAFLLGLEVVAVYNSDRVFSKNKFCLYAGCIASFGLGIVGVVNEKEDNTVHSTGAVVAFVLYAVYMVVMAWNVTLDPYSPMWSIILKQICAVVTVVALLIFAFLATDWGKYHLYIAILEWTATALILIFQLSFAADLSYVSCLEVSYHSKQGPQQKGNHEEEEEEDEKDICRLLP